MKRFAFFAALACVPLTARAQVALTPTGSVDVNPGFFYILNIHEYSGFLAVTDVELLWTYEYPPHRDPEWIKVYAYSNLGFRTYGVSWSLVDPSDPRRMLFSTVKAGRSTIVGQTILPGGWWTQEEMDLGPAENAEDFPAGLAGSPGAFVGTFDVPEDYAEARAGRGSMTFYGDSLYLISPRGTQLHSYDVSGFTAIPEPSTYAALLGAGALGFACWRRRRAKITLN